MAILQIPCNQPTPARADTSTIIAVAGPRTGIYAHRFKAVLDGVKEAVADHSARQTIRVIAFDDGCQPAKARSIALKIVASRASLVIGHPCDTAAKAADSIYTQAGLLFIGVGQTRPISAQSSQDRTTFKIARTHDHISANLVTLAGARKIALVHDRTRSSRSSIRKIADSLRKQHEKTPLTISIEAAQPSYSETAHTISRTGVGVVYFSGFPTEARILIKDLHTKHAKLDFIASTELLTRSFIRFAQTQDFDGSAPDHDRNATRTEKQRSAIRIGINVPYTLGFDEFYKLTKIHHPFASRLETNSLKADAYAALQIWMESRNRTGAPPAPAIAGAIRVGSFKTRIGNISFNAQGIATRPASQIFIFDAGKWIKADPLKSAH